VECRYTSRHPRYTVANVCLSQLRMSLESADLRAPKRAGLQLESSLQQPGGCGLWMLAGARTVAARLVRLVPVLVFGNVPGSVALKRVGFSVAEFSTRSVSAGSRLTVARRGVGRQCPV
jgi:hypothetical protein